MDYAIGSYRQNAIAIDDHTAPLFKKLNLLTIKDILALQELKLYYTFLHNNLPPYIQQWQIKQNTNIHNHYTRNQNEFYIVGTKHAFAKQCLKNKDVYFLP